MTDVVRRFRAGRDPVPGSVRRWHLYGAGLDSLEPAVVPLPEYRPDELLVRHDAVGICFSDIKIVTQGPSHARLQGRDMQANPVVMGHEVALTVVGVGHDLRDRFSVGQRFIMQADVYYKGENPCYGYQLSGGMAEYGVVTKEVLHGDEGTYLVPLQESTGYVEAALVEPWACVVAAYEYPNYRDGLRDGGRLLEVRTDPALDAALPTGPGHEPARIVAVSLADRPDWAALRAEETGGAGFDDIIVYGTPEAADLTGIMGCLGKRGILNVLWDRPLTGRMPVDVGRVHYEQHLFVGAPYPDYAAEAYQANRRQDLKPGGAAWFIGAGGPMGQMQIQRAIMLDNPPGAIIVSDRHDDRLDRARERFSALAEKRGIALHLYNVKTGGEPTAHGPFDDIVSMAPSAQSFAETVPFLADGGVYNIFAGLAKGTLAEIDLGAVLRKQQRLIGTSGSSLADLRHTLEMVEAGTLSTASSLAAIGGLNAFRDGLAAVKEGRFPGKTVIFPQIRDLPLTPLPELRHAMPEIFALLQDGRFWTREAEEALLAAHLHFGEDGVGDAP